MSSDAKRFVEWLQVNALGHAAAKSAKQIRGLLGFKDRTLRILIQEAARAGVLICAGNDGYFVPLTYEETEETTRRLKSQAFEMLERARRTEALAAEAFNRSDADRRGFRLGRRHGPDVRAPLALLEASGL